MRAQDQPPLAVLLLACQNLDVLRRQTLDLANPLRGPEEKLSQDLYAQLAVHVTNCAYAALLSKMNITPRLGSGFSLGIFSALELVQTSRLSVLMLDKGRDINERRCSASRGLGCVNCSPCSLLCGWGGERLVQESMGDAHSQF
jgi:hypothetical protein